MNVTIDTYEIALAVFRLWESDRKIPAIKLLRTVTDAGLKTTKDLLDNAGFKVEAIQRFIDDAVFTTAGAPVEQPYDRELRAILDMERILGAGLPAGVHFLVHDACEEARRLLGMTMVEDALNANKARLSFTGPVG